MRSVGYHQFRRNCISSKRSFVYHHCESFLMHTCGVMRYKGGVPPLMIYTLTRDDIPLLSQWIKNPRSKERGFFGASNRARTCDTAVNSRVLYRLSYQGKLCWRLPIFPGSCPPSIFGASELNFRVRDGNGWTLTAISTNFVTCPKALYINSVCCLMLKYSIKW